VITIRKDQMQAMAKAGNGGVTPCPNSPLTWIEVALVDQDNKPVAGAHYRITLSDGKEKVGNLDSSGMVRFDQIPEGFCLVRFPDVDGNATALETSQYIAPAPKDKKTWIELKVIDERGRPKAWLDYEVTLPDQTIVTGSLDRNGFSRIEDIPSGTCKVRFPGGAGGVLELQSQSGSPTSP
jgi:hypothetical protein